MLQSLRTETQARMDSATAHVGSNLKYARHFEEGTKNQPPRSFLGSSAVEGTDDALKRVIDLVSDGFKGR